MSLVGVNLKDLKGPAWVVAGSVAFVCLCWGLSLLLR
jgi:hypothetical protein